MKIVLLLLAFAAPVAQAQADEVTIGLPCQFWSDLSGEYEFDDKYVELIKTLFVKGIYEGAVTSTYHASVVAKQLAIPGSEESAKEAVLASLADNFYTKTSYKELANGLNGFCADHLNKKIAITEALQIISMGMKGVSADSIEARTNLARQLGSDEP